MSTALVVTLVATATTACVAAGVDVVTTCPAGWPTTADGVEVWMFGTGGGIVFAGAFVVTILTATAC